MQCKKCGNEIENGSKFCTHCGVNQALISDNGNQWQNAHIPCAGEPNNGRVGFGKAVALFFKNYVNFSGRASRSEYWWIVLFNVLLFLPLALLSFLFPLFGDLCTVALTIPQLSLSVRRLHDVGKSGAYWFMGLIPFAGGIILLVQYLKKSDGDNQWGPGNGNGGNAAASAQFENAPASNVNFFRRTVSDQEIYAMAQSREPIQLNTLDAKQMLDAALSKIVPDYTGTEPIVNALMRCDPQAIKANIAASDTETLLIIFKALGYYIGQGGDANVLGSVQQNVLTTLKTRL